MTSDVECVHEWYVLGRGRVRVRVRVIVRVRVRVRVRGRVRVRVRVRVMVRVRVRARPRAGWRGAPSRTRLAGPGRAAAEAALEAQGRAVGAVQEQQEQQREP